MIEEFTGDTALERLRELIKNIDVCMMTTCLTNGQLRSRPMSSNGDVDTDGTVWFFASKGSPKVDELVENPEVNLSFSDPKKSIYVSISGKAEIITERETLERHWKPELKAWFPKGLDEEGISLLKVSLQAGNYWETQGNFITHSLSFAKALLTGTPYESGQHGTVTN